VTAAVGAARRPPPPERLAPEALRRRADPAGFAFASTADVEPLTGMVRQPRVDAALDLVCDVGEPGFNLFVTRPDGVATFAALEAELRRRARARPTPPDLICLFDFADPARPCNVALPAGRGPDFARDVDTLVDEALQAIRAAFESQSYRQRHRSIHEPFESSRAELLAELRETGRRRDIALELTPAGVTSAPLIDGKPAERSDFERLSAEQQAAYTERVRELEPVVADVFGRLAQIERAETRAHRRLDREIALLAVGRPVEDVKRAWSTVAGLGDWLDALREDMIDHLELLRTGGDAARDTAAPPGRGRAARHRVNVLVTHAPDAGAPVVAARDASAYELFGRIDFETAIGAAVTDHLHIRPGAVHRAAGGFLILQVQEVLTRPFVWSRLKALLRSGEARIENVGAEYMLFPSASLDPQPIRVDLTVVLVGTPRVYTLLHELDADVRRLFKVHADFDDRTDWDASALDDYAAFVSRYAREHGARHADPAGVARLVEHGARLAGHRERLATRFAELGDVLAEANRWAARDGAERISAAHVDRALQERRSRADLGEQRRREATLDATLRVDVDGTAVGQVNGLAVAELGDRAFGFPVRVTATAGPGQGRVLDIDREAELSGPIHDKAFLILAGLLRERFGATQRLALQASIVFEQSYGPVEGDSASLAELVALLSALARRGARQDVAVTGSVDQHGHVQAVGGINEKIEGFFALCRERGLTGTQGVVIPSANRPHLMLDLEVVDAVRRGEFAIWSVATVDDALELLVGDPDHFAAVVAARLGSFAAGARRWLETTAGDGQDGLGADGTAD
jgi:predicted ATP-dependent protease